MNYINIIFFNFFVFSLAFSIPVFENIGEVLSDYRVSGKTIVTLIGHSGQGYEDEEKFRNKILDIVEQFDSSKTIINIGVTPDGIGRAYEIIKEIAPEFETRGIVSELALEYIDEDAISGLVDKYFVIKDSTWGGYSEGGKLSSTSEAMVAVSHYVYGLGGGDVGFAELTESYKRSKNVIFDVFDINHDKAIKKAIKKGLAVPEAGNDFLASASLKYKPQKQVYFLDRMQQLALEFIPENLTTGLIKFKDYLPEELKGKNRARVLKLIKNNLKLVIDGQSYYPDSFKDISLSEGSNNLDLYLGEQHLGNVNYNPLTKNLETPVTNLKLSPFDMRQFAKSSNEYLKKWNNFKLEKVHPHSTASLIDIHSHFGGAIRAESLINVSVRNKLKYPAYLLKEIGINVGTTDKQVDLSTLSETQLKTLQKHLSIPLAEVINFTSMEKYYERRSPLTKNPGFFKEYLIELAKDYQKSGVDYAELSISDIVKPEYLNAAHEILPEIEKTTGVKLRFVVGMWRLGPPGYLDEMVEKTKHVMHSPYVVGVDFMGHESNSTFAFEKTIRELAELRQEHPDFKIKVHAGENPLFPENVRVAIDAGATHLSHVLYGVDKEMLEKVKEKGIILDFAGTSNYSLNNIYNVNDIPIKKYMKEVDDLKISIATDGHGLYQTNKFAELDIAIRAGLSEIELSKIFKTSQEYVTQKISEFKVKIKKFNSKWNKVYKNFDSFPKVSYDWGEWSKHITDQKEKLALEMKSMGIMEADEVKSKEGFQKTFQNKKPLLFSGASKKSILEFSEQDLKNTREFIFKSLSALDPSETVIVTGGTDYGVEKIVHEYAKKMGFDPI